MHVKLVLQVDLYPMHGTRSIKVTLSYTNSLFGNPETDFLHISETYLI